MKISIVAPIYNESAILPELYSRLKSASLNISSDYELLFVNDGSKDESLSIIKRIAKEDNNVKFISFSRNFGHQNAITAGIDNVTGDVIVIIDGDLQDPPELISELFNKYLEGYKVVYAKRKSRKGETFSKKLTAKVFYRLLAKITSVNIPVDTGDFRLIDKVVVEQLKNMPEYNKFIRGQIAWIGFSQTYVEYSRDERKSGKTAFTFRKMFKFAIDGITSFSNLPLKVATYMGFLVSGFAFLIILYALYSKFILDRVISGWTSLIISTMFIGGVQLLTIGIIGEYISRINDEVKKRPQYIVEETNV
ncbi:MAG: glycosyltransferase family 2 protein [Bacteroidota bacterium]|nr:glycosyltransferase family 2 protein [Bacteroidota bacterium]